jgi:hypothetical protein
MEKHTMPRQYTVFLKDLLPSSARASVQVPLANFGLNEEEGWREADFTHPRTGRRTRAKKEAASTAWFELYDIELFIRYHNLEIQAKKLKEQVHTGSREEDAKNWRVYADADAYDYIVSALLAPNPLDVLNRKITRATGERSIYTPEQEGFQHHQHVITLCQAALAECETIAPVNIS